jgi:hypothetical protein
LFQETNLDASKCSITTFPSLQKKLS